MLFDDINYSGKFQDEIQYTINFPGTSKMDLREPAQISNNTLL